jgi:hypothetical protein
MEIAIIILAYVANVFLNRYINKIMYRKFNSSIDPFMWFLPIPIMVLMFVFTLIVECLLNKNWFTGKNW